MSALIKYPKPVAVLDEHNLVDEDGHLLVKVSADKLHRIAHNGNRRIQETGDYIPIVIGHTKDGVKESDQPEIVGYAGPFYVAKLFRTGRQAVWATIRFFKDKINLVRKFPRRSAELWLNRWEIDPIALLGASAPERDLGMLHFRRSGGLHYRRTVGGTNPGELQAMPEQDQDLVAKVVAALQQTSAWKYLEKLMGEHGQEEEAEGPEGHEGDEWEGEGAPGGEEGQEDIQAQPGEEEQSYGAGEFDAEFHGDSGALEYAGEGTDSATSGLPARQGPDKFKGSGLSFEQEQADPQQYGASAPSGGNTYTPGGGGRAKRMSHTVKYDFGRKTKRDGARRIEPVRLQRDQLRLQVSQLQSENKEVRRQVNGVLIRLRRAEREKDLIQLEGMGYQFDRSEELDAVQGLPTDKYKGYMKRLMKRYQRAPVGVGAGQFIRTANKSGPGSSGRSREDANAAVELATSEGISYEAAVRRLHGEGAEKVL
jgi:hypothetical protein